MDGKTAQEQAVITNLVDAGCGGETDAISFFAETAEILKKKYPLIHYHIYSGDANPLAVWKGAAVSSAEFQRPL